MSVWLYLSSFWLLFDCELSSCTVCGATSSVPLHPLRSQLLNLRDTAVYCTFLYMRILVSIGKVPNSSRMCSWHYKSSYQFRPVPVPWYRAVAVFLVCHNMYGVDVPRAPSAHTANSAGVGSLLVPDSDQVSKHASLVTRPRVWLSRQAARWSSLINQIARSHVVDIWIMISLADYSSWRHDLSMRTWPLDCSFKVMGYKQWVWQQCKFSG